MIICGRGWSQTCVCMFFSRGKFLLLFCLSPFPLSNPTTTTFPLTSTRLPVLWRFHSNTHLSNSSAPQWPRRALIAANDLLFSHFFPLRTLFDFEFFEKPSAQWRKMMCSSKPKAVACWPRGLPLTPGRSRVCLWTQRR